MSEILRGRLVTVNLNDDVLSAIDLLAARLGMKRGRSEILRLAALDYCAREMAKPTAESLPTSIPIEEEGESV